MDIYTKLQLEKRDQDLQGEIELFEDILNIQTREGHPVDRAILQGRPGMGKTTLFDKVAYIVHMLFVTVRGVFSMIQVCGE